MSDTYFIFDDFGNEFEVREKENEDLHQGWRPNGWNDPEPAIKRLQENPIGHYAREAVYGLDASKHVVVWSGDILEAYSSAMHPLNFISYENAQGDWAESLHNNRRPNRKTRLAQKKQKREQAWRRKMFKRTHKFAHIPDDFFP